MDERERLGSRCRQRRNGEFAKENFHFVNGKSLLGAKPPQHQTEKAARDELNDGFLGHGPRGALRGFSYVLSNYLYQQISKKVLNERAPAFAYHRRKNIPVLVSVRQQMMAEREQTPVNRSPV